MFLTKVYNNKTVMFYGATGKYTNYFQVRPLFNSFNYSRDKQKIKYTSQFLDGKIKNVSSVI